MTRKLIIILSLLLLFMVACSSKEQREYEDLLEQAKGKIIEEEFNVAYNLLTEAIAIPYEKNEEVKDLHNQLKQYRELDELLDEGKFKDTYEVVKTILKIENGSSIIEEKAIDFEDKTKKAEKQYKELENKIDKALALAKDKKYTEANKLLEEIELSNYEASYYNSIKKTIKDTIDSNNEQIEKEKQRKKKLAEQKKREEEERKNNMLSWSNKEVEQYMANYIGMDMDHLLIEIYNRTDSGFSVEVRQNNAAMGLGDPNVAPALGFFEVRKDGKLYELDRLTGAYHRVN